MVVSYAEIKTTFANFTAAEGTTYEAALFNLVEWVQAHNFVENLLRAAHEKNDGNQELQAVFKELMGPAERALVDLEPLLKPLEALAADAWSLYDKIAKSGWDRRARQGASIVEMARDLARMTERQEKGRRFVPLLAFVEGLCDRIKQGKDLGEAGPLEGWLEKTSAGPWGIPRGGSGVDRVSRTGRRGVRPHADPSPPIRRGGAAAGGPATVSRPGCSGPTGTKPSSGGRGRAGSRRRSTMWRRNFPRC